MDERACCLTDEKPDKDFLLDEDECVNHGSWDTRQHERIEVNLIRPRVILPAIERLSPAMQHNSYPARGTHARRPRPAHFMPIFVSISSSTDPSHPPRRSPCNSVSSSAILVSPHSTVVQLRISSSGNIMATGVPQNTGTGDYVKAPENYQREMPIGEQLGQIKEAAKVKVNEFADQNNLKFEQAQNDPSNKASDVRLKQDIDTTANDAANSYNKAVDQVTSVVNSVKGAFTSTRNQGTATPTTTPGIPETAPARPAQSVSESIGQTAATITDAVKNAFTPNQTVSGTQPGLDNMTTNLPQDVPRRAPQ